MSQWVPFYLLTLVSLLLVDLRGCTSVPTFFFLLNYLFSQSRTNNKGQNAHPATIDVSNSVFNINKQQKCKFHLQYVVVVLAMVKLGESGSYVNVIDFFSHFY